MDSFSPPSSAQMASPPANSGAATLLCSRCIHHVVCSRSTRSYCFGTGPIAPHCNSVLLRILIHWLWTHRRPAPVFGLVSRSVQLWWVHQMFVKARRKECSVICIHSLCQACFEQALNRRLANEEQKKVALIQRQEKQWAKSSCVKCQNKALPGN